jgi:ribosomal protein L32
MAVPKKRVSKMRKNLRHTNWKKEIIPQALIALSKGKSSRLLSGLRMMGKAQPVSSFREGNVASDVDVDGEATRSTDN